MMVFFVAVGSVGFCILSGVEGGRGEEMCGSCARGEMLEDLGAYL